MATLKDRFLQWKQNRTGWKKAGDVLFWLLLVLLILPGPRKVIATAVNRIVLLVRTPSMPGSSSGVPLQETDFRWTVRDVRGEAVPMDVFRGQVIFLNFWATWCPPCVAELPEIQKAYDRFGEEVAFVLVTGEDPAKVTAFFEKHGYELPVYFQTGPIPDVFAHRAIPTTFIVSRDERIVLSKKGAMNWDSGSTSRMFQKLIR